MAKPISSKAGSREDSRRASSTAGTRQSRAKEDQQKAGDRALSDDERVEMFRQQFIQSALPDLPKIPGYHNCWLTTTNPRDSIQSRIRLGYEPITPEDIPGWEYVTLKTGEYAGFVGVNEMLAFKLPESLYQKFMAEVHHNAPLAEEEKLRNTVDTLKEQAERIGGKVLVGEGDQELGGDERLGRFDND